MFSSLILGNESFCGKGRRVDDGILFFSVVAYHRSKSETGLRLMITLSSFVKRVACSLFHISLLDAATCVFGLAQCSSNGKRLPATAKMTLEKC